MLGHSGFSVTKAHRFFVHGFRRASVGAAPFDGNEALILYDGAFRLEVDILEKNRNF